MNIEQSNENWPRWHVATRGSRYPHQEATYVYFAEFVFTGWNGSKVIFVCLAPRAAAHGYPKLAKEKVTWLGKWGKYEIHGWGKVCIKYKIQTLPKLPQGCDHPASWQSCYPSQMKICKTNGDKKQQVWYKSHLGEIYFSQTLTKARKSRMVDAGALECATHYII